MFHDILELLNSGKKQHLTVDCTHKLFLKLILHITQSEMHWNYEQALCKTANMIGSLISCSYLYTKFILRDDPYDLSSLQIMVLLLREHPFNLKVGGGAMQFFGKNISVCKFDGKIIMSISAAKENVLTPKVP